MARFLTERVRVVGTLVCQGPVHVGGVGFDPRSDLPLARDGQGRYCIPGTSLVGVLRAWCRDNLVGSSSGEDNELVQRLWGYHGEKGKGDEPASLITVEDAVIPADQPIEVRDGVGIHRATGTAAHAIKFDRAILPTGTQIPLRLLLERTLKPEVGDLALLAALVDALKAGEIRLGAATTRGLGRVKLAESRINRQNLSDPASVLALLRGQVTWDDALPQTGPHSGHLALARRRRISIELDWRPDGAVMTKAGESGLVADILPLTTANGGMLTLVLPGAGIKGALRSHAERIVRTVIEDDEKPTNVPLDGAFSRSFLEEIEVDLVTALFGIANKPEVAAATKSDPVKRSPVLLGRGALSVDDCHLERSFDPKVWREAMGQSSAPEMRRAVQSLAVLEHATPSTHIAVDRLTGAAADGALFTVLEPLFREDALQAPWQPLRFSLDLGRLSDDDAEAALALLLLVIRDFAAGSLPVGFAGNRGLGTVRVSKVRLNASGIPSDCPRLGALAAGEIAAEPDLGGIDRSLLDRLSLAWRKRLGLEGAPAGSGRA
ncbi:MAG: hypothetical protein GC191_08245 [Azospirillum sp.]|nr:hypothetical protein [Azospirillum sp.]